MDNSSFAPQSQSSFSASSSPPQPSTGSTSFFHSHQPSGHHTSQAQASSSTATFSASSHAAHGSTLGAPINPASALSPIANRMRERDADAMEKYLRRNRSGSQGTSSTDNRSQNGSNYSSAGPSAGGDDITSLNHIPASGTSTPRRLRPSLSAAQLRTTPETGGTSINGATHPQLENRNRSGTNPIARPSPSPLPLLTRSSSTSTSPRSLMSSDRNVFEEGESYIGPPSQYAQFPEPPHPIEDNSTPTAARRKAYHILSKPQPSVEPGSSHRRGMSAASVR